MGGCRDHPDTPNSRSHETALADCSVRRNRLGLTERASTLGIAKPLPAYAMDILKHVEAAIPFFAPYPDWTKALVAFWALLTTLLLIALLFAPRKPTEIPQSRLVGQVVDATSRSAVANASVEYFPSSGTPLRTTTDSEGRFDIDLSQGTVSLTGRIRIAAPGFRSLERNTSQSAPLTDIGLLNLSHDLGSATTSGAQGTAANSTPVRPLTLDSLTRDERQMLEEVRAGKYVDTKLESFLPIVVLSGQVTESELDAFLNAAKKLLAAPTNYYATGEQDAVVVGKSWQVFIWRTHNPEIFRNSQAGVLQVIDYLIAARSSTTSIPADLVGVSIKVRGTERFFDIDGIPGSGQRTWIGFDLRR